MAEVERARVEQELMSTSAGRRWLRGDPYLTTERADLLLAFGDDFRTLRRDRTLASVIERASPAAIERHIDTLAAGPVAPDVWKRLTNDPTRLVSIASNVVATDDEQAAESTIHLLVIDPLDPLGLGEDARAAIAASALDSVSPSVRGLAAEYLATHASAVIQSALDRLITDDSEYVRGVAWNAALRADRSATVERATTILSDETFATSLRRSALLALGAHLPTSHVAGILSYFVVHPDHDLASDAAELLYQHHRNPTTATAARDSPHADVREIAERLLDPLRGSPAAGGSRPGDPTRSSADIYADMLRVLEEKAENQSDGSNR
jgi:hypothetical protein